MSSRPPSRIFSLNTDEKENILIDTINKHLYTINPRAFSINPPLFANTQAMKALSDIIKILNQNQDSTNFMNHQSHILAIAQINVIICLYNHLAFLISRQWTPQ